MKSESKRVKRGKLTVIAVERPRSARERIRKIGRINIQVIDDRKKIVQEKQVGWVTRIIVTQPVRFEPTLLFNLEREWGRMAIG